MKSFLEKKLVFFVIILVVRSNFVFAQQEYEFELQSKDPSENYSGPSQDNLGKKFHSPWEINPKLFDIPRDATQINVDTERKWSRRYLVLPLMLATFVGFGAGSELQGDMSTFGPSLMMDLFGWGMVIPGSIMHSMHVDTYGMDYQLIIKDLEKYFQDDRDESETVDVEPEAPPAAPGVGGAVAVPGGGAVAVPGGGGGAGGAGGAPAAPAPVVPVAVPFRSSRSHGYDRMTGFLAGQVVGGVGAGAVPAAPAAGGVPAAGAPPGVDPAGDESLDDGEDVPEEDYEVPPEFYHAAQYTAGTFFMIIGSVALIISRIRQISAIPIFYEREISLRTLLEHKRREQAGMYHRSKKWNHYAKPDWTKPVWKGLIVTNGITPSGVMNIRIGGLFSLRKR